MNEGEKYGVNLWLWIKIKDESADKLDPLRIYYEEKIRLITLRYNVILHDYIDQLQGLEILWRAIEITIQPEHRVVTQMVEYIGDPVFSGTWESIKNWAERNKTFRDAPATLRAHDISKLVGQTKNAIEMEVNSLLLGSGSNKRRATGEPKALCAFRLGGNEDKNKSEESITLKDWKMLTPESSIDMWSGEEVNIGLVKDGGAKEIKCGGGKMSSHHKKDRTKFLRLNQSKGRKNDASYMKSLYDFITGCCGPS